MPLKDEAFYRESQIDLRLSTTAVELDPNARRLTLEGGARLTYDALLLATGAEANRPDTPGFERDNVHVLRTLSDSEQIIAAAKTARSVAIVGSSFIGLEVAAAMRARGIDTAVIAPEAVPLESKLGPGLGGFIKRLHEAHGVSFHLGRTVKGFDGVRLVLDDNTTLEADLVILGVGVKPRLTLAQAAGLHVDKGVIVDAGMRTSDPHIYAAGDIACYPNPMDGALIRVEHWVVAERQGQVAAANIVGLNETLSEPPFFWSAHYDASLRYVGHAEQWDRIEVDGAIEARDATVRFFKDGEATAVVTLGRDAASIEAAETLGRTR
jgi:NADPH-dependent 2,4-dienoyl-CoA reductase/sulfur reductase-like enzyme